MILDRPALISDYFKRLPISEQEDWLRRRKACDKSLFYFIKDVGNGTARGGGDIIQEIHKPICDSWQDRSVLRQFVYMPRYWRKSTCLTMWGNIWEYLQDPEVTILIPSEKQETAGKWVTWMGSQIVRNERLRWLYPELQLVDQEWTRKHRWSSLYLDLPHNGIYPEATIECVGIRGAAQGGHYKIISPDDLVGEKGLESDMTLADATRWFDNVEELLLNPALDAKDPCRIHGCGTHWAPGDLGEYIQQNYPEYKWIIVPCQRVSNQPRRENVTILNNPRVAEGESNFPESFSTAHYVAMAANPAKEIQYWAQHMNMPTGASKMTKFDYSWFRWYTLETRTNPAGGDEEWIVCDDGKEFKLAEIQKYGFIDPGGFAETKVITRGSRNALLIAGQPETTVRKFVFEAWAGRLKEPQEFLDRIFGFQEKWKCRMWRIETIAAQKYIYKDIIEERRRRNKPLPLMELDPDVGKDAKENRITALIDPVSRGEYFFHRSMKDLISEVKSYPGGMTKDLIDMLSCYNRAYAKRREQEKRFEPPRKMVVKDEGVYSDGASEICGY